MIFQVFILTLLLGLCLGWLLGNFHEWDNSHPVIRQLEDELHMAYGELDELREIIYTKFGAEIRHLHPSAKRIGSK
jgi:uncharacterized membrane-anchored protein YhcB (DUF1043 family)